MAQVFIGIGSNLQQPLQQVMEATDSLQKLTDTKVCLVSSCYQTPPLGPADQADFINRVVSLETRLPPLELLNALQKLEEQQGRIRRQHWGPRVIDLDILLYDNQIISLPQLTVPHVGLKDRAFFLYPLVEIAPDLILPTGEQVSELKRKCTHSDIKIVQ